MKRTVIHVIALLALCVGLASAGPNDPIVGEEFARLVDAQGLHLQTKLSHLFSDTMGYLVTGPLDLDIDIECHGSFFTGIRVICPNHDRYEVAERVATANYLQARHSCIELIAASFRGSISSFQPDMERFGAVLSTVHQSRFLFWLQCGAVHNEPRAYLYAQDVSDYLYSLDTGWMEAPAPKAVGYGLPDSLDFYAPPPDYVIEGYDNYLSFLNAHDTIRADFAYGLTEFVPSDSLWDAMKTNAPHAAYPNKEWPMLQHEYRKFFERGGDVRVMQTLTHEGFDTLQAGEYFFAVSVAGKVRFGRELLREEVKRIEAETGKKVPRANHAFLFPGEPVLTAGAFYIEDTEDGHRLSHINAQSGHYFYSNVSPTIREDIAVRSDEYLLTLGHFFKVLDKLNIPHDNVVVSKL